MSKKAMLSHDPIRVIEYLKSVSTETGTRHDQIRVNGRPGFHQPAEIDAGIFHIEETIDCDHSLSRFGDGIGRAEFADDVGQCGLSGDNEGDIFRCQWSVQGDANEVAPT